MPLVNIFTLDLDLKNNNYISEPIITSNDTAKFIVNITDDGLPFDLTGSTLFTLASTRPDGTVVLKTGVKTGSNQLTFDFGAPSTTVPGRVNAKIQMYDASGRVSALDFTYMVSKDPSGTNYVPTSYDQTLIQQVIGEGPEIIEAAGTATNSANDAAANANKVATNVATTEAARVSAENTRVTQESTRQGNETARIASESNRASAESGRATAETNRASSETSRVNNESLRVTAETNRNTAEAGRTTNESARIASESARASAETARQTALANIQSNMQIQWKGTVTTYAALPSSGNTTGDTYSVIADGTASNNAFWRWSGSQWVKMTTLNPTGTATQSDLDSVDIIRADLFRQKYHSGVFDYLPTVISSWGVPKNGEVCTIPLSNASLSLYLNKFRFGTTNALLNGYKVQVAGNVMGSSNTSTQLYGVILNELLLNAPPTSGYREDLVFLEAWFPQTGIKGQMSWRIRTVAGVDFEKYTADGFHIANTPGGWSAINRIITAQGGNSSPITQNTNTGTAISGAFVYATNQSTFGMNFGNVDDKGLYIAGTGDALSKTTLATADGYVYAIPLFRIKRRNSGGYRKDNPNGARDYVSLTDVKQTGQSADTTTYTGGMTVTLHFNTLSIGWQVGDRIAIANSTSRIGTITAISIVDGQTAVTMTLTGSNTFTKYNQNNYNISDRPDGLYSNIIDASDIIDLRHRVPISPQPQMEVESAFDSLIRGALTTKDAKLMQKDVYGLRKAPLGISQQLQSTKIKRTYGPSANLLGDDGNCEDLSKWSNVISATSSLDTSVKKYGLSSVKAVSTAASGGFGFLSNKTYPIDNTKYYLLVADVYNASAGGGIFTGFSKGSDFGTVLKLSPTADMTTGQFVTLYCKLSPADIGTETSIRPYVRGVSTAVGQTIYGDGIRLYEIDKATYDLIDVDANYTGSANIATKFPYVDSDILNPQLINLLGTDGNCEDLGKFVSIGGALTIDSTNYLFGSKSVKVTSSASGGAGIGLDNVSVDNTKYYVAIASMNNATNDSMGLFVVQNGAVSPTIKSVNGNTTKGSFVTMYVKLSPTDLAGISKLRLYPRFAASASGQIGYVDGLRLYEIDQSTYNLIDVDPNWTGGDKIGALFPYVDSYPNFVENICSDFTSWSPHANAVVTEANKLTLNATATGQISYLNIPCVGGQTYSFALNGAASTSSCAVKITTYDSSDSAISSLIDNAFSGSYSFTRTVESNAVKMRVQLYGVAAGTFVFSNFVIEKVNTGINYPSPFVPYGRWYLDKDYLANSHLVQAGTLPSYHYEGQNGGNFNSQRLAFSDALTSQNVMDVIDPTWNGVNSPKHLKVTQATAGVWTSGDKIVISSDYGAITGVVDSDTQIAKVLSVSADNLTVTLDDVSKLSINDTVKFFDNGNGAFASSGGSSGDRTIMAIDTTNKTATLNSPITALYVGMTVVENTASTSLPTVTATGIAGTWTNLGTKSATYTITTAPTTNTSNVTIGYSVNYPAGKGISQVATDILKAEVNGQELLASNTVSVKANFAGKTTGSTDANPNKSLWDNTKSSLLAPSASWFSEYSTSGYSALLSVDNSTYPITTTTNGQLSQASFQFDLIRAVEDKYGEIPADDVAAKVAWLKANISSIQFDWYGYGSGPSGNKAYLKTFVNNSTWVNSLNHTNGTVTKLTDSTSGGNIPSVIASNGFVYYLAYADASDGVTASVINTDYVELSITLNTTSKSAFDSSTESGFTVLQPTNPFPVMSENLLTQNQAFPVDWSGNYGNISGSGTVTVAVDSLGVLKVVTDGMSSNQGVYVGSSAVSSGLNVPANTYMTFKTRVKFPSGATFNLAYYNGSIIAGTTTFTGTGDWQDVQFTVKDASGIVAVYIRSSAAVATTFYIGQTKAQLGVTATEWTPGRKKKVALNYLGKISGSVVENPHRFLRYGQASLWTPGSANVEQVQSDYTSISSQDGVLSSYSVSSSGNYAQHIFEFDLSHLGMTTAELKKALRSMTAIWIGCGAGDNAGVLTNGSTVKFWNNNTQSWTQMATNTYSVPSSTTSSYSSVPGIESFVTKDQKIYMLTHSTYPSSANYTSQISTDYIKLDITLADYVDYMPSNIVKMRPETKEMKLWFPAKSGRYIGGNPGEAEQVALWYRYAPYQGLGSINKSKILAVGTPIITTLGTGASPSDGNASGVGMTAVSTRLPSPVADSSLIADKFTSEGVLTTIDTLSLKGNPLAPWYRLTPKAGNYLDPTLSTSETIIRGASSRAYFSTDAFGNGVGGSAYKFSLPTTLPYEALISLPMLVLDNGEMKLVVVSFRKSKSSVLQFFGDSCVYDQFKLPGRPLVKGV